MRHKAVKLFSEILDTCRNFSIDLIMKAFEDVAVDFAWEILKAFKLTVTTRSALELSFDDYSKGRRIFQYPSYKTQTEMARERERSYKCPDCGHTFLDKDHCPRCYQDKKYGYMARPGIVGSSLREQGFYTAQDVYDHAQREKKKSNQHVIWYMSPEDAEYLWGCMPKWIKDGPGDKDMKPFCTWYGTLTYEGDLKVHNEVKRILNR